MTQVLILLNQGRCFSLPVYKNIPKYQKPLKKKKTKPSLKALVTFALDSMAGLQYYFFPTDFFYPRPSSTNGDSTSNLVLHVQTQKADAETIEKCKIVVQGSSNKLCYQPPPASTSCTALVPSDPCIIKKESRRNRFIVANCGNDYCC